MSELNTDKLISQCIKNEISFAEVELHDARLDLLSDYKALREYHNYAIQMQNTVNELNQRLNSIYNSAFYKACGVFRVIKRKLNKKTAEVEKTNTQLKPLTFTNGKKQLLFFDLNVPSPDKDAGSRSVFDYFQVLREMDIEIKFLSDAFLPSDSYSAALEKIGVSVLNDKYYADNWQDFIIENGNKFDYFVFNRPLCASKYMDIVKKHTNGKLIYLGCDLHFLREMRDYELNPTNEKMQSIQRIKLKEYVIMHNSQTVIMYSQHEKEVIEKEFDLHNVAVAPLYCLDTFSKPRKPFFETKDVLFVGGFSHAPNIDAVLWFYKEVWQKLQLDDAKFIVAGANPTKEIQNLKDVVVTGYISHEELSSLYANCRVCVIPLRFGAGIKGKLVEAMAQSIPIVSTSIGTEGITNIPLTPANTAQDFAAQLKEKYLKEQNINYESCLKENFSKEKLKSVLSTIFS